MEDLLLFAAVGFAAMFIHSFVGFGGALVSMPILTMFVSPRVAIPAFALMVLVMDLLLVVETRVHVNWRRVAFLLAGGVIGSPIGAFALKTLPTGGLYVALNVLILLFAVLLWCNVHVPLPDNRPTQLAVGLTSGLLGGCIATSGPPVVIFGLARQWQKDAFRGTLLAYFTGLTFVSVASYTVMGMVGGKTLVLSLAALAGALPAAWIGVKLKNRVGQKVFRAVVLAVISFLALLALAKQFLG